LLKTGMDGGAAGEAMALELQGRRTREDRRRR
jgi:hypothetical protein